MNILKEKENYFHLDHRQFNFSLQPNALFPFWLIVLSKAICIFDHRLF